MEENEIYEKFMAWLKKAPMSFTDSEDMTAFIKARYTPEDAALLTDVPFDPLLLEEIAAIKNMKVEDLRPRMDALAEERGSLENF